MHGREHGFPRQVTIDFFECGDDRTTDQIAFERNEARLRVWEEGYVKGMDRMRRLVVEFYEGLNFGRLVRRNPDKKGLITDVLIGNLVKDDVDELWPLIDAMRAEDSAKLAGVGA